MRNKKMLYLTVTAILMAVIILQTFIPWLGYIKIAPAVPAIVTIQITVLIGADLLGVKGGAILGLTWGLTAWFSALTSPDPFSQLVFVNPIVCVVPRILVGIVGAWIFGLLHKKLNVYWSSLFSAIIGTATNTILVLLAIIVFYGNQGGQVLKDLGSKAGESDFIKIISGIFVTNGSLEIIASAVIVPVIVVVLYKLFNKKLKA